MPLEIIRVRPEHAGEIAPIIFHAFRGIHEGHNFPLDIPSMDVANMMAGMFATRPDVYGVVAVLDGKIVGSNFVQISDAVAGVGPITVDPACQSRGIGRALMHAIVDWSLKNHGPMVRLMQDGFNMTSLSLYTSIGFTVMEPVAMMEVKPADIADDTVRPLTQADVAACDELCQRVVKMSRRNELSIFIEYAAQSGFVPHGRFVNGKLKAYVVPGFLGHAVGETAKDFLIAVTQAVRNAPPPAHKVFIPVRNGELFRGSLNRKMRAIKLMSLMALGPYDEPMDPGTGAAWSPSIAF